MTARIQVSNLLRRWFTIDLRALAAFRILLSASVLIDLFYRFQDIEAFYTDDGTFPVQAYHKYWQLPVFWSVHALSGELWWQILLFAFAVFAAGAMLIGWRTRLFTIISWGMMLSIQNRNPMVLMGVDQLMMVLLFFSIFLPWQKRYSIDARKHPEWQLQTSEYSFASAALMLQVTFIYIFSYVLKTGAEWTSEGTAIYYTLSVDELVKPLGKWLLQFQDFLRILTFIVLRTEILIPILFFFPIYTKEARYTAFFMVLCLHIGFWLTLLVSYFPLVNVIAVVIFIPEPFWDWLDRKFMRRFSRNRQDELESPYPKKSTEIITQGIPVLTILYVLWWNLGTIPNSRFAMPVSAQYPGYALRLCQAWDMFAPFPLKDDGWFAMPGDMINGKIKEVWRAGPTLRFGKPKNVIDDYANFRWEKYMHRLWEKQNTWLRTYFAEYTCRNWNESHPPEEHLKYFRMFYIEEFTMPPGVPSRPTVNFLGKYSCGD